MCDSDCNAHAHVRPELQPRAPLLRGRPAATMDSVSRVVTGVKDFYSNANPANLSGAIDVVVVKQVRSALLPKHSARRLGVHARAPGHGLLRAGVGGAHVRAPGPTSSPARRRALLKKRVALGPRNR